MSVMGHFRQIEPAPDALGMSASLRSRPNLRTAAIRRGVRWIWIALPFTESPVRPAERIALLLQSATAQVVLARRTLHAPQSRLTWGMRDPAIFPSALMWQ